MKRKMVLTKSFYARKAFNSGSAAVDELGNSGNGIFDRYQSLLSLFYDSVVMSLELK